jgi:2-methylisocitrate lyase-like PEP mutase family enzyme
VGTAISQAKFTERRARFRALHASGCFVIPNPFDAGSARFLARSGFEALASTSSGSAFSLGYPDGGLSVETVLSHVRALVDATELPINADFENGFASGLDGLAHNVRACAETGVAALSIEDSTHASSPSRYTLAEAVERIKVARDSIDAVSADVMLVGRAEHYLVTAADPLADTIARLSAYADAGADILFAPGLANLGEMQRVVEAVAPKPVNVLIGHAAPITLEDLRAIGVRRVSVGGGLAEAAWGALMRAARRLQQGRFDGFADNASYGELNALFADT